MKELNLVKLAPHHLEKIRKLEEALGGVCLLAVEKAEALYAVEAKIAPNTWVGIEEVYSDIPGLKSYFSDQEEAHLIKVTLKNLLRSGKQYKNRKLPIRIREI